jgi:DNA-directed RNA polymerase subunit RPC12/RpoP
MIVDTLYRCERCGLRWVEEKHPNECPRCRRNHAIPPRIIVAGRNVTVEVERRYGLDVGLMDPRVRSGLEKALFHNCCPHGYLTSAICPDCP